MKFDFNAACGIDKVNKTTLKQILMLVPHTAHFGQPLPVYDGSFWHIPQWVGVHRGTPYKNELEALTVMAAMCLTFNPQLAEAVRAFFGIPTFGATQSKQYLIGIDPSLTTAGFALYGVQEKKLLWLDSMDCYGIMRALGSIKENERGIYGVVLEDPNCQQTTFAAHKGEKMTIARAASLGIDAGRVMAAAQAIEQTLKWLRIDYTRVNPSRRTCVKVEQKGKPVRYLAPHYTHYLPTKTNGEYFATITGWAGSSNEDERDAAMLVSGRTWANILACSNIDSQPKIFGR